ncbi:hypothetical protein [uncultured Clostridium sp.]|uniref:hypothetical protein n=1 Tax=uncultured Clostridium sp. TaxID=59620 RepID=UPI00262FBA12|nr:hypothetical protein [uncultured Clostridium sp.]
MRKKEFDLLQNETILKIVQGLRLGVDVSDIAELFDLYPTTVLRIKNLMKGLKGC